MSVEAQTRVMHDFADVRQSKPGGSYFVKSRTTEGAWWCIEPDKSRLPRCSCPAGRHAVATESERLCWHQRRLYAYISAMDEAQRRPSAPANVSALVD